MSLVDLLREGLTADHPFGIERTMAEAADEIERLRGLLMESRVCVSAELGEYEAFLKRPGMHPDAYVFGNRRLGEVDNLLACIDAALAQPT